LASTNCSKRAEATDTAQGISKNRIYSVY
jgi:hypothetical protein